MQRSGLRRCGAAKLILMIACLAVATALLLICQQSGWYPSGEGYRQGLVLPEPSWSPAKQQHLLRQQQGRPAVRCRDLSDDYPDSIPPLIHFTSKDGRMSARLLPIVESWRQLINRDNTSRGSPSAATWHFMHWDDEQIGQLINAHYPQLKHSYSQLANGLERSDIGRLVVLHHVGGVYVDLDVELHRDLSPLLKPSLIGAVLAGGNQSWARFHCCTAVWSQEPPEHAVFNFDMEKVISNAVILTRPRHSFLTHVLRSWPDWFQANWALRTPRRFSDAVNVTGPLILHRLFEEYMALAPADRPADWNGTLLADSNWFQPIWDAAWMPMKLRWECTRSSRLSALQRRQCEQVRATKFRQKRVPPEAFTVHRYMHLSYTDRMDLRDSRHIREVLPILPCSI